MKSNNFTNIVNKHQSIIYKICLIYRDTEQDREDLFQDILYQLWRSFDDFRNESKVSTWLYKISLNTALSQYRRKTVILDFKESLIEEIQPALTDEKESGLSKIMALMKYLNGVEKALLSLYLEGYSHKEIGQIVGCSENNVSVKINRLKKKLKKITEK